MKRVCVCGKKIAGRVDLCKECSEIYGLEKGEWPEWLKFYVSDLKREYMAEYNSREITFTDLGFYDNEDDDDLNPDEWN